MRHWCNAGPFRLLRCFSESNLTLTIYYTAGPRELRGYLQAPPQRSIL